MRLYKTSGFDTPNGDFTQKWDGTQADAAKRRKEFKDLGLAQIDTKEIDVPTDKAGLLAWLNAHCTGE